MVNINGRVLPGKYEWLCIAINVMHIIVMDEKIEKSKLNLLKHKDRF